MVNCLDCGKEMEKGKLTMSSWPIPGVQAMIPMFYWCKGWGLFRGKDRVNLGIGMSKDAYICKECKTVLMKY